MRAPRMRIFLTAVVSTTLVLATASMAIAAKPKPAMYEVTIVNLTPGQPLGPSFIGIPNSKKGAVLKAGKPARSEIATLAETGYAGDLFAAADAAKYYDTQAVLFAHPAIAGGVAGAAVHPSWVRQSFGPFTTDAPFFVNVVSGMPCTNDGFAASGLIKFPKKLGQVTVAELWPYDAGTEQNTELIADMSPLCQYWLEGQEGEPPAGGEDQPELAKEGVVTRHPGIAGAGDLDPWQNGWEGPVGLVIVKAAKLPKDG